MLYVQQEITSTQREEEDETEIEEEDETEIDRHCVGCGSVYALSMEH